MHIARLLAAKRAGLARDEQQIARARFAVVGVVGDLEVVDRFGGVHAPVARQVEPRDLGRAQIRGRRRRRRRAGTRRDRRSAACPPRRCCSPSTCDCRRRTADGAPRPAAPDTARSTSARSPRARSRARASAHSGRSRSNTCSTRVTRQPGAVPFRYASRSRTPTGTCASRGRRARTPVATTCRSPRSCARTAASRDP